MIVANGKIKQRIADAADLPSEIPSVEVMSSREIFLRKKFSGPPRGAQPGPYDPNAESGWTRMQKGERGKQRFTPQNHRQEKGDDR